MSTTFLKTITRISRSRSRSSLRPPAFLLIAISLPIIAASFLTLPRHPLVTESYEMYKDVPYRRVNGQLLTLDLCLPKTRESPVPVVLLIHGGGWTNCDKSRYTTPRHRSLNSCNQNTIDACQRLASAGFAAASINYRLVTKDSTTQFPAQLDDIRNALQWFKEHALTYRLDPTRIAAWGESSGGTLASLLGVNGEVTAVVSESGLQDLTSQAYTEPEIKTLIEAFAPTTHQKLRASPIHQITIPAPFFFVHGERDTTIPPSETTRLEGLLKTMGVRADTYWYDGGHNIPTHLANTIFQEELHFLQSALTP